MRIALVWILLAAFAAEVSGQDAPQVADTLRSLYECDLVVVGRVGSTLPPDLTKSERFSDLEIDEVIFGTPGQDRVRVLWREGTYFDTEAGLLVSTSRSHDSLLKHHRGRTAIWLLSRRAAQYKLASTPLWLDKLNAQMLERYSEALERRTGRLDYRRRRRTRLDRECLRLGLLNYLERLARVELLKSHLTGHAADGPFVTSLVPSAAPTLRGGSAADAE